MFETWYYHYCGKAGIVTIFKFKYRLQPSDDSKMSAALLPFANSQLHFPYLGQPFIWTHEGNSTAGSVSELSVTGWELFCWPSHIHAPIVVSQVHLSQSPWDPEAKGWSKSGLTSTAPLTLQVLNISSGLQVTSHGTCFNAPSTSKLTHSSVPVASPFLPFQACECTLGIIYWRKKHKCTSYLQSWGTPRRLSNAVF